MIRLAVSRAFAHIACFTVILFSLAGHAFAQDNQVLANAPDLKVGDRWEYVRKDIFTGDELGRFSIELTDIVGDTATFRRTTSTGEPSSSFKSKLDGSVQFQRDGTSYSFKPLVFPLTRGATWESTSRGINPGGHPIRNYVERHVSGVETLSTPCGVLKVIRIDGSGYWENMDPQHRKYRAGIEETLWYSPEMKRIVKTRVISQAGTGGWPVGAEDNLVSCSVR